MSQEPTSASAERIRTIREVVVEVLEIEPDELTPTSRYVEDHGADSLRAIEILARLEKKFKVVVPQEELVRMTTLDNTYAVFKQSADWSD
jgi:acyl carrier protein